MNGVLTLVLFDAGATRSSVSLALNKRFGDTPEKLDYPIEVENIDDHLVRTSTVHRGCILELF